ncbi:MAG: GNAT family N-acetyltransferase [Bdellovibrionaceae bacterium]|nr:GNAT family N-acetyltransferase [Pseudobdellovibrionaceae bacterium]
MQIRPLEKKNHTEIARLYQIRQAAYTIEAGLLSIQPDLFFPLQETLNDLQNSTDEIFVSVMDGSITGAIFLEKLIASIVISNLFVDPKFFRRGIARALIAHCLSLYPKKEFHVGTGKLNSPAIRLYETFKFEPLKEKIVEPNLRIIKLRRLPSE